MARIGGHRWRALKARVLAEEGGICWLCGEPGADSADHVIPVRDWPEGEFVRDNVRAVHHRNGQRCNLKRGARAPKITRPLVTSVDW